VLTVGGNEGRLGSFFSVIQVYAPEGVGTVEESVDDVKVEGAQDVRMDGLDHDRFLTPAPDDAAKLRIRDVVRWLPLSPLLLLTIVRGDNGAVRVAVQRELGADLVEGSAPGVRGCNEPLTVDTDLAIWFRNGETGRNVPRKRRRAVG